MAQKESFNLIIIGIAASWLIAAPAFAAISKSEAQKYPPVSGEIYGQVFPGVRSITVNNKPVLFDNDFNFKTTVNLKAGEKYITLKINYSGLRIIKRYLILRKGPIKKFEVHVPKEKIIESIAAAKPAKKPMEVSLPTEQVTPTETLASQPTIPSPTETTSTTPTAEAVIEEAITTTTVRPASATLPLRAATPKEISEIKKTKEKELKIMPLPEEKEEVKKGKEKVAAKPKKKAPLSLRHPKKLVKKKIIKLAKRPAAPPKKIRPAVVKHKPCDYRYVWEFSRGKLLLVREQKGIYSAQIHIPSTKQWIDIKDISSKDLKEIMIK